MTASAEKERAECRAAYEKYLCPYKGFPDQWTVWQAAWQAARRVQAENGKGWGGSGTSMIDGHVVSSESDCMTCSGHGAVGNVINAELCPDCTPRNHLSDAAPVQLPESISKVLEDCRARAIDYATCPSPYNHTRMDTAFQHLVHQVNQILATLSPAPPPPEAIQKSVQALVDAAILEGGSPPPSQEAAMQATEQRKADLLKLLEPFIGTPLNE